MKVEYLLACWLPPWDSVCSDISNTYWCRSSVASLALSNSGVNVWLIWVMMKKLFFCCYQSCQSCVDLMKHQNMILWPVLFSYKVHASLRVGNELMYYLWDLLSDKNLNSMFSTLWFQPESHLVNVYLWQILTLLKTLTCFSVDSCLTPSLSLFFYV